MLHILYIRGRLPTRTLCVHHHRDCCRRLYYIYHDVIIISYYYYYYLVGIIFYFFIILQASKRLVVKLSRSVFDDISRRAVFSIYLYEA